MECTQACVKLSLRTVKFAHRANEIAPAAQLRKIQIFHMSFRGNEVTERIQRSEMRLRIDCHVATLLLFAMTIE